MISSQFESLEKSRALKFTETKNNVEYSLMKSIFEDGFKGMSYSRLKSGFEVLEQRKSSQLSCQKDIFSR